MTLQELLIVCAIIGLLVALVTPTLTSIKELRRRGECRVNNVGFATLCHYYAMNLGAGSTDPTQRLPVPMGSMADAEAQDDAEFDNFVKVNEGVFTVLNQDYGLQEKQAICAGVGRRDWMFDVTVAADNRGTPDTQDDIADEGSMPAIYMGVIYWGGRADVYAEDEAPGPDVEPVYNTFKTWDSHKRQISDDPDEPDNKKWVEYYPTGQTLITCLFFDVDPNDSEGTDAPENASYMPHARNTLRMYPPNDDDRRMPEGIVVAKTDLSAKFVQFEDLESLDQYHRIWYQP